MKAVKNILFWIAAVCMILMIIAVGVPKLFGVEFRAVISGSMSPEIPVGSLVVVVPTNPEDIQVGDDITFVSAGERVVTHRVVEIDRETNEFITWGIANDPGATDAPNRYENIIGVVRFHLPYAGRIFSWFSTTYGRIIMATAIIAAFLLSTILGIWAKGRKDVREIPAESTQEPVWGKQQLDGLLDSFRESETLFGEARTEKEPPSSNSEALSFEKDDIYRKIMKK